MKAQSGFTLVELMVVITMIGIILTMVTLNFHQMTDRYNVESSTKEIYSVLQRARNDSSTTNTTHLVVLAAKQVQTGIDANGDGAIDGAPHTINYPQFIINSAGMVAFDRRGLTTNFQTISITGYSAAITPAVDCIVIAATRINMGKMTGGVCVQR